MAAINITEQAAAAPGFEVPSTLHLYYHTTINDHTSYTALLCTLMHTSSATSSAPTCLHPEAGQGCGKEVRLPAHLLPDGEGGSEVEASEEVKESLR